MENTGSSITNWKKSTTRKSQRHFLKIQKYVSLPVTLFQKANKNIKAKDRHGTYTTKKDFRLGK